MDTRQIHYVAQDFRNAPHLPEHWSWGHLLHDIDFQWERLNREKPMKIIYSNIEDDWPTCRVAISNRAVLVYKGGNQFEANHPLAQLSMRHHGHTYNSLFRACHDVLGHFDANSDFSLTGEMIAYWTHRAHFSDGAIPALYSEVVGSTCYFEVYKQFLERQKAVILNP